MGTACLLPRASASSLGIDEARILALPGEAERRGVRMRALMVARHGKVGAELFWQPLLPSDLVRTHSVTKSVVAMAAGCLVDDGLLSEDDLVLDLLPEYRALVDDPMGRLGRMRVRHLLSMTSGHLVEPPKQGVDDELLAFLQTPMDAGPGERFFYTSAGVNALSAILERTGGANLEDLLRRRVLGPIGGGPLFHGALPVRGRQGLGRARPHGRGHVPRGAAASPRRTLGGPAGHTGGMDETHGLGRGGGPPHGGTRCLGGPAPGLWPSRLGLPRRRGTRALWPQRAVRGRVGRPGRRDRHRSGGARGRARPRSRMGPRGADPARRERIEPPPLPAARHSDDVPWPLSFPAYAWPG
ncbi:MAG: serine hydrolase [Atopobiaceae bacterium]|nr:serine hydrolase [Atopobiaceae bacterium]